jgi:hypothetical protein
MADCRAWPGTTLTPSAGGRRATSEKSSNAGHVKLQQLPHTHQKPFVAACRGGARRQAMCRHLWRRRLETPPEWAGSAKRNKQPPTSLWQLLLWLLLLSSRRATLATAQWAGASRQSAGLRAPPPPHASPARSTHAHAATAAAATGDARQQAPHQDKGNRRRNARCCAHAESRAGPGLEASARHGLALLDAGWGPPRPRCVPTFSNSFAPTSVTEESG